MGLGTQRVIVGEGMLTLSGVACEEDGTILLPSLVSTLPLVTRYTGPYPLRNNVTCR